MNIKNKSKSKLKLSRRDRFKRNPLPWVALLLLAGVIGFMLFPDYQLWNEKSGEIKTLQPQNKELGITKESLQADYTIVENEFNEKAISFLEKEKQVFPEKIKASEIAQIIEVYSVLLDKNGSNNASITVKSMNIGKATLIPGKDYAETTLRLAITADENSYRKFIKFLQSREISNELRNRVVKRENRGDGASVEFLNNNKLPVMTIQNINLNENKVDFKNSKKTFNVQLQILLYSQTAS